MKKAISLIAVFSCLFLSGCMSFSESSDKTATSITTSTTTAITQSVTTGTTQYIDEYAYIDENGVLISRGKYYNMNWENMSEQIYKDNMIPDKETAVAIATVYLENMYNRELKNQYIVTSIFYDEVDTRWIVTFARELNSLGGDAYHIMMDQATGEVLYTWYSVD